MSYVSARDQLEQYLESSGLNPKLYELHIFRSGGAPGPPKTECERKKHGSWVTDQAKDDISAKD